MEDGIKLLTYFDHRKERFYEQVNGYLRYCILTRQMSPWTISNKKTAFKDLIAETDCRSLESLTNEEFNKFIKAEVERGIKASSVNQKITNNVAMIRYWREMGLEIPLKTPFIVKLRERPIRRVFYTREEIRKVLRRCNSDLQWLLIKVAFDTGMRIAELTNLSRQQMNGRRINFIGKGTKAREVYICDDTYERLTGYIELNAIRDRIWLNRWGYPLAVNSVRRIMREAFTRCGYTDFHPHALRHSFGSDIQRRGADVMVIKEMMGHSSVATTQRYLHGFEGQLEALFRKYKG